MLDSPIEEIKSRLPILDLVQDFVQLKKAGTNYKGLCPFHGEKTASFMVSPAKQIWHCFGCGLGGDIFEFIKQMENVEFVDALKILADRTGIELRKQTFEQVQTAQKKDVLSEINEQAAKYYAKVLWDSQAGSEALQYLRGRGLTDQTIKNWQLGYAPDDYHYLENYLAKGFDKVDIELAGLILKGDRGDYFDRFHDRVMFPIINLHGQVVGFTGRLLHDKPNTGKYVNSPETPIYNKSREIYGLFQAKNIIRKENRALLVEGNMDVITAHQSGFNMAVATSGTALTEPQLVVLKRFTENLVFAFDSDAAGATATRRALELALTSGFNVKIANLAGAKDPDELIKRGIGLFVKALEGAGNFLDFFFDQIFKQYPAQTVEGKREITKELGPLIFRIADPITKAHYIRKLAQGINVAESAVWDIINKLSVTRAVRSGAVEARRKSRREILQDQVLGLSLILSDRRFVESLGLTIPDGQEELLKFAAEVDMKEQGMDPKTELPKIANELKKMILKERMQEVATRLTVAETAKDRELVQKLSQEYTALINQMSN